MRNTVTAAAAALFLTLGLAAPALADHSDYGNRGPGGSYGAPRHDSNDKDDRRGGRSDDWQRGGQNDDWQRDRGRDGDWRRGRDDRRTDFNRHERRFDHWERGWRNDFGHQWRHGRPLSYHQIVFRLQRQGYYGVHNLRKSRWSGAWRAFAYTGRGRPVMLQINPYNGRVMSVRYLWA